MAVPPATSSPQDAPAQGTACILWTAAPAPPSQLTALLAQRGFALQAASDRFAAMAAACSAASQNAGQTILILDEPEQLKGRQELIEALQGRAPNVVIWTFQAARRPQLAGLDEAPATAFTPNRPTNGAVHQEITLRLADSGPPPAEAPAPEGAGRPSILSPEELEMLLADEPEEGRHR